MKYESKRFKDGQVTAKIIEGGNIHIKIRGIIIKSILL